MGQLTILDLQEKVGQMEQVSCPVEHLFAKGLYCRTIYLPAGSFVIGKRHKEETLNILLQGKLSVYKGENEEPETIEAPQLFVTQPNVKKVVFAHTGVLFANVHATEQTDVYEIEKEVILPDDEYEGRLEQFNIQLKELEQE